MMVTTGGRAALSPWRLFDVGQQRVFGVVSLGLDDGVAEFFGHQRGGVVVDGLGDGGHHAHLEQRLDHVAALQRQLLREIGHGDGVADRDFAHDRCGRLEKPCAPPPERACSTWRRGLGLPRAPVVRRARSDALRCNWPAKRLARIVVLDAGDHRVRAAGLVLGRRCGRRRAARRPAPVLRMAVAVRGGRLAHGGRVFLRPLRAASAAARASSSAFRRAASSASRRARLDFLGAALVDLGQLLLLGEVALLGFLQLAQDLGALVGHRPARPSVGLTSVTFLRTTTSTVALFLPPPTVSSCLRLRLSVIFFGASPASAACRPCRASA